MKIYQIFTESALRNFSYLLTWETKAICIDPFDAQQIQRILGEKGLKLTSIINTHEHLDHYCGNEDLVKTTGCQVWAHPKAKGKIPGVNRGLSPGEKIPLGEDSYLEVLETPGHTFAHLCLLLVQKEVPYALFTGDTLFNAGVGNCHGGGDPEILYFTIRDQFHPLPDHIFIYPGHEYLENNLRFTLDREDTNAFARDLLEKERKVRAENPPAQVNGYYVTTVGVERKINTFFRLTEEKVREGVMAKFPEGTSAPGQVWDDKNVFLKLRALRDKW